MSLSADATGCGGNFKGVMFSNRPSVENAGSASKTFSCGLVAEPLGIGQSQMSTQLNMTKPKCNRKKKVLVVEKHKKWLAELQLKKTESETLQLIDKREKEEALQKLQESESKRRQKLLKDAALSTEIDTSTNEVVADDDTSPVHRNTTMTSQQSSSSSVDKSATTVDSRGPSKQFRSKPTWALTAEDAEIIAERNKSEEEVNLLHFVEQLDFKSYVHDIEIQTMVERIKSRIESLESDIVEEEKRETEAKERAKNRWDSQEPLDSTYDICLDDNRSDATDDDDHTLMEAARKLLHYNNKYAKEDMGDALDLKAIHSNKSIAAILKSYGGSKNNRAVSCDLKTKSPTVSNEPIIVLHTEESRGLPFDVSRLPYMHRNPAV